MGRISSKLYFTNGPVDQRAVASNSSAIVDLKTIVNQAYEGMLVYFTETISSSDPALTLLNGKGPGLYVYQNGAFNECTDSSDPVVEMTSSGNTITYKLASGTSKSITVDDGGVCRIATVNGKADSDTSTGVVDSFNIYAPTVAGTTGYILQAINTGANGDNTPTWVEFKVNGQNLGNTLNKIVYAPTTAGTNNYILKSNGSGAPTWVDVNTLVTYTIDDGTL